MAFLIENKISPLLMLDNRDSDFHFRKKVKSFRLIICTLDASS